MTDAEIETLQIARANCAASVAALDAVLRGVATAEKSAVARDAFVSLKIAAAAWGITDDAARKKVKRLAREHPEWVTKRGAGRWLVHREALR